jgi:Dolichyl-phosphate-mannose-protein mannosyltransferase
MDEPTQTIRRRAARILVACAAAVALSIVMTWPLAAGFGSLGRTRSTDADGMLSIWNVSWVARTLTADPVHLFDANIFHPHRWTLAFSELNLIGGVVGIPGWLFTNNPYVTHNSALLFSFSTSLIGAFLLARRLSGSSSAATAAAVMYAFCPYFFSHSAHIQLLMGGGIPLSLLMLHRLADAPSPGRGVHLGLALAGQALACAYYGIFAGLMVGYATIFLSVSRGLFRRREYWLSIAVAAAVSVVCVLPFFIPFLEIQEEGFRRTIEDSQRYSANLASYMASPAHAHAWLLELSKRMGRWSEVLFPGGLALLAGLAGLVLCAARPHGQPSASGTINDRETLLLYGSLAILAIWASFGPDAGFYLALFHGVPLFSFLRAPSRFGVVVPLVLGLFAALALARLTPRVRPITSLIVASLAAVEVNVLPFPWSRAPAWPAPYRLLAQLPKAPVAEFPFYGERVAYHLHTQYMLFSTGHWQPLVNGYSDHIPADFRQAAFVLDSFPSNDSFAVLRRYRVRYVTIHWDMFGPRQTEIRERLRPFAPYLRELSKDEVMTLYEILGFP